MIVVDTNVIAYLFLRGPHSAAVDRLLAAHPDWAAPRLWLDEFLNVLVTQERNGLITPNDAVEMLDDANTLMDGATFEVPPDRVLAAARRTGCTAYDSQYVTLAEDLGLMLYTFDKKILVACPSTSCQPM
jgi:predicted nucleic acid-binding protein